MHSSLAAPLSTEVFFSTVLGLRPPIAVFDCDGTLWGEDTGYEFMLWSIAEGIVSRGASDWIDSRYRLYRAGKVSEIGICGEMVQLYEGVREIEMRQAAAVFFRTRILASIFPEMLRLVDELRTGGANVWAVSSTNNWVIEEGLRGFNIPADRILATRVEVVEGTVTSKLIDVPSDEGKALALKGAGISAPAIVFGNSIHDAAMLEIAQNPFAVNPTQQLQALAAKRGWPVFFPTENYHLG